MAEQSMYRQIAENLREQIISGQIAPGAKLRTEIELREHYGASRNTVRDAIKWLITLGLVETRPGQGTFVVQKIDPFVTTLTTDPKTSPVSRNQKRYIDKTPWSLQTSFYPMGFVLQGADKLIEASDIRGGTVKYLAEKLGLRQVSYSDWIKVRAPNPTEALFFDLPQDGRIGVFEIFRTAFDHTGTPMRLTVSVFPTDRNEFIVNVGDVPSSPAH
jgi:GntR family transcriptional regulator